MRKFLLFLSVFYWMCFGMHPALAAHRSQEPETRLKDRYDLGEILVKCADYCERIKDMAFHFVCHENITEQINSYDKKRVLKQIGSASGLYEVTELKLRKSEQNTFVYDYQMIKKGDDIQEKRILLKENGKEKHQENARLKLKRYWAEYLVFGPVGFLSKSWQPHFQYEIVGQEEIDGKRALILSAVPNAPREDNYNFGMIWVDAEGYIILKIQWDQRSIKDFDENLTSSIGDLKRNVTWTVEYGLEKKGVRFPSEQTIEETYIIHTGSKYQKYLASILYDRYKFFTVETQIKY